MKKFEVALLLMMILAVSVRRNTCAAIANHDTYRAAVVEYKPLTSSQHDDPLQVMLANVGIYIQYATDASGQGADIIVFPEYGITTTSVLGGRNLARTFSVVIPDPQNVTWNPCLHSDEFPYINVKVLTNLSCAARHNSIVLVANLISQVECDPDDADSKCPSDGRFQFNTNVAFSKDGTLLARYHKRHLYGEEPAVNPAPEAEFAIFDAGFARFGMFICFDILFKDPAVQLVTEHGIQNLVYPTMWVDQIPFRTAIQIQESYALGLNVNILASNYFRPEGGQLGSGIYSSVKGAIKYTNDPSSPGTMLVADVPIIPSTNHADQNIATEDSTLSDHDSTIIDHSNRMFLTESFKEYNHSFIDISKPTATICQNDVCCQASYDFGVNPSSEVYVAVALDKLVKMGKFQWYFQICAVVRCETSDIESCGQVPGNLTTARFNFLKLTGNFSTEFLFPSVSTTSFDLLPTELWNFNKKINIHEGTNHVNDTSRVTGTIETTASISNPLRAFAVIGRDYNRD